MDSRPSRSESTRGHSTSTRGKSRGRGAGKGSRGRGANRDRGSTNTQKSSNHNQVHSSAKTGEPGVNKIKASLRQVRRLLAKPDLPPSTKDEAERRLKVLEQDLETKEKENLEKDNSLKFRKIRFFERKRCERRIGTLKLKLEEEQEKKGKGRSGSKDDGKDYETMLTEAREMLNYVLHFPLTETYVPLFPRGKSGPFSLSWANLKGRYRIKSTQRDEQRDGGDDDADADDDDDEGEEDDDEEATKDLQPTDPKAKELAIKIHTLIKEKMQNGEMDSEPETSLKEVNSKAKKVEIEEGDQQSGVESEDKNEDHPSQEKDPEKAKTFDPRSESRSKRKSTSKSEKERGASTRNDSHSESSKKTQTPKTKEQKKVTKSGADSKKEKLKAEEGSRKKRKRIDLGLEDGDGKKQKTKNDKLGRMQVEEEKDDGLDGDDFFE